MVVMERESQTETLPPNTAEAAVQLAAELLECAEGTQNAIEKEQARKIAGMMDDADGKALTMLMSDQAFRSEDPVRVANQIRHLLDEYGIPGYFAAWERAALWLGAEVSRFLPHLVVPFIVAKLRQETQSVILPGAEGPFQNYLKKRRASGTRLNINHLGEAILGEGEAERRLDAYLKLLARPDVEYISVKISSIFSQINLVAFEETVEQIEERLRTLYRQAMKYEYTHPDGRTTPKFINLDMEEYRDLHITVAAFQRVLDEPEFKNFRAGIVLQGYLPDSAQVQRDLTAWAMERVARGGAPIKMRIVKGANLAMERVEASIHDWPQAPYKTKAEVDANYKRMVTYGCDPQRVKAVNLGIASHNLFDLAYAMIVRDQQGIHEYVEFEMLEGMANHQARVIQDAANGLLLYAPVVKRKDFHSAIAYLVRRLDENTAPENFLHDIFDLEVGSEKWIKQRDLFLDAYASMDTVGDQPQRQQNRQKETIRFDTDQGFHNIADTDFALPQNQAWARGIFETVRDAQADDIPLQIAGELIHTDRKADGNNPAHPGTTAYRYALASPEQIDHALNTAVHAQAAWALKPVHERRALLIRCAEVLAERRSEFLGVMMRDGGKTIAEADPEVSEGIDFANYYARSFDDAPENTQFDPYGVVLVTPPWNFPMAIPTGGVVASLMAGNAVIFKPAPEAMLVGWHIANALWDAGIPKDVLQFVPTTDDEVGKGLVTDDRVNAVILTGAYETARMFQSWKPDINLLAETSGKNALIVTAMADRDQAIKDLVKSAFGHAGQKCSASSLGILEAEVYDDPTFRRQLKDAAQSLKVGPASQPDTVVAPIIREPDEKLHRALTTLEPGESWLLEPQNLGGNCWTPGIKLGVKRGSFFHKTECFGPVLGLMRADSLEQAIDLANDVDYGLTGGLHTLDDREIEVWRERVAVGNAYINRGTTGAIVQRQPFGGWKQSAFGYAKAGGPNYTFSLGTWRDADDTNLLERTRTSYTQAWDTHFSVEHDSSQILGESNVFRYRPLKRVILRVTPNTKAVDIERVLMAAQTCSVPMYVSLSQPGLAPVDFRQYGRVQVAVEDDAALARTLQNADYQYDQRLRILDPVPEQVRSAANDAHVMIADAPVVSNGRLELRHYMKEQSVTQTVHRYGNIIG